MAKAGGPVLQAPRQRPNSQQTIADAETMIPGARRTRLRHSSCFRAGFARRIAPVDASRPQDAMNLPPPIVTRTLPSGYKGAKSERWGDLGVAAQVFDETYRPSDDEPFMNDRQRDYFRRKLIQWREDILRESRDTLAALQSENENHPDLADRASSETDRAIELRARDRQRKLISKIESALGRLDDGTLWLLRGDGRADLVEASRRPADRDPFGRGAGAPRAARARVSGCLTSGPDAPPLQALRVLALAGDISPARRAEHEGRRLYQEIADRHRQHGATRRAGVSGGQSDGRRAGPDDRRQAADAVAGDPRISRRGLPRAAAAAARSRSAAPASARSPRSRWPTRTR